jgi:hypothetical protein
VEVLECVSFIVVLFLLAGEAYQTGKGRYLGDDGETSGEPPASAGRNVGSYRSQCAEQVPGRVQ